ncbi:MAG: FAD-binding protein [Rhodospirillales bacterium]|nr:FAD-binding protein [Rhodospirillales bacterium]MDP7424860.1 FAD-binding protein [Rhodospirillales bacterium]
MTVLVIADHDNAALKGATFNTVTAAQELGDVTILVAGSDCGAVADEAAKLTGINKVLVADDAQYANPLAEVFAPLVIGMAGDYTHILASATTFGKNLLPRVAALLDVQQISEITAIQDADIFERPIYAGNAIATVQSNDATKLITVRATAFEATVAGNNAAEITAVDASENPGLSEFISTELTKSDRPELTAARVIISGGRGMQGGEHFAMLEKVADILGAAVGASRAAVDSGFVSNDYQVGQTGKIVAPELYIAVGISGAIQHLAGMKDSKVIVAINKDEEAPIFQVADYGLVADLFKAVPELEVELEK